ncbi:MAG: four helix bundle protein [Croceivirga sp.]
MQRISYDFALYIVNQHKDLTASKLEFVLSKQLLRSETAVGVLIREAEYEESRENFWHKMNITLKEENEIEY